MSRDGPFVIAPMAPHARIADVMLPPESPTLSASSSGNFCSKQKIGVIGTKATINSKIYTRKIKNISKTEQQQQVKEND